MLLMERENAILRHTTIVQPFIKDAFEEGAHRIKPKHTLQDRWDRQIMIGVVYNDNGSTATLGELADKYSTFRQCIGESNKSFLRNLWNNSSPELQDRYPLSEILSARKPLSQRSRERRSLNLGGTSLRIKAQVEGGVTDIQKISENTGLSRRAIVVLANTTLKEWGVNIPRKTTSNRAILEQLDRETDDKKIQELLDRTTYHVILYDLKRKREASQFSSLSPLIKEAGFRSKDNHPFATSLKNASVPISITERFAKGVRQTYYIVLSRHKDRAIKALKKDQSLQRFQRESR